MTMQYWSTQDGELLNTATGKLVLNSNTGKPLKAKQERLLEIRPEDAMPARPRGDAKERTFNLLIRDGTDMPGAHKEADLIGENPGDEDRGFSADLDIAEEYRQTFGEILDDHYVIEVKDVRFLYPFQSILPANFVFHGRYKMFNGKVLAFLAQPSAESKEFNAPLIDGFYELFNRDSDMTLLDKQVMKIARRKLGAEPKSEAAAGTLIRRYYGDQAEAPGALVSASHLRFQRDLNTVLKVTSLNRRDRISYAINIFYVHLALYMQRLAWLLEEEFRLVLESFKDQTVPLDRAHKCFGADWYESPFKGTIKFRVASGKPRPVSEQDGCVISYRDHNRRLMLLSANLSVLGAAREVMVASGQEASKWSFAQIAEACRQDTTLAAAFNEALWFMAEQTVSEHASKDQGDIKRQVDARSPGIEVLREALLKIGRSSLRRYGRDIVHALVQRGGRGYISERGRGRNLFEIGQDLLLLLAKVIVGDKPMPFPQFLAELERYGFSAQTRAEQDKLADTLLVLNLLSKYSDAGEAMYVKHFL